MRSFSKGVNVKIFILSIWMLFLELFLIRWISTEIRIFAYASNLVLLACFIGIGAGAYFSNKKINVLFSFLVLAVTALAVKSVPFIKITDLLSVFYDSAIWSQSLDAGILPAVNGIILTLFMFSAITAIFFPIGQLLGKLFSASTNIIAAYSVNILGNLLGIWIFGLLSFSYTTPVTWLVLSSFFVIYFMKKNLKNICFFLAMLIFLLIVVSMPVNKAQFTSWSPYQKLDVNKIYAGNVFLGYTVNVNNANYMEILDISPEFIRSAPGLFEPRSDKNPMLSQYEIPYLLNKDPQDVLIVGSGGGNDVAGALRRGINSIDAVEIDPGIYNIGLMVHPEKPYSNKRVNTYIDDARSFFKKTGRKYDVISFGLLDSHTFASNYNNVRLDHYMYTTESFKEARDLLKKDGVMTVAFASTRPWIDSRLRGLIRETFNTEPLYFEISPYGTDVYNRGWIMYVVSNNMEKLRQTIEDNLQLKNYITDHPVALNKDKVALTTDDWPYLYLKDRSIPSTHLCIIISLLILFTVAGKTLFTEGKTLNFHFFFLGAAFMLLEFQNISKASLLFGSTWLVNAYMFTAIMALILLSNLYAYYFKVKRMIFVYALLAASIVILYFISLSTFNVYTSFFKGSIIAVFMNIPIFFAGLIFIYSFRKYPHKNIALGSNLMGACVGGLLESLSFVMGIKALLVLVLVFYLLSYVFDRPNIFKALKIS
ncbi:MAG: hypothetical protein PHN63_03535 [Candidatus Omnitrophica bacterium]|nr:hypothetical protein [Candidatus Omnitrophota bacterium]